MRISTRRMRRRIRNGYVHSSAGGVKPDKQGNNTPLSLRRRKSGSDSTSRIKVVGKKTKTWLKSALANVNAFMTVPMYAALLSIFIAMIPPLQAAMAKLKPVEQAIRSAGSCSSKSPAFVYSETADPQSPLH
jgi:hypothetical protein